MNKVALISQSTKPMDTAVSLPLSYAVRDEPVEP